MRGWSSFLIGFFLLSLAFWSYAVSGFGSTTLLCGAGAALFFVRGAQGMTASQAGDVGDSAAVIEFVTDPAGAIVDTAAERLGDWFKADEPKAAAEPAPQQPKFDPDAALARYLERRAPEPVSAPAAAPVRTFGRKRA